MKDFIPQHAIQFFGGGAGTAPTPPKFKAIDLSKLVWQQENADLANIGWGNADLASRFPGMVQQNQDNITNAYNQLNGPLDPTVQNSFVSQGASQALGASGGGDPFATLGDSKSGFGANTVAKSVANSTQAKQDADRNYWEQLMNNGLNQETAIGPSGGNYADLFLSNYAGKNNSAYAGYAGQLSNYNAQQGAAAGNQQAAIGAGVSILSSVIIAI